jgi:hypothetical protein
MIKIKNKYLKLKKIIKEENREKKKGMRIKYERRKK